MFPTSPTVVMVIAFLIGVVIGYILRQIRAEQQKNSVEIKTKQLLLDAKQKAQASLEQAKQKAENIIEAAKQEEKERTLAIRKMEERFMRKEEGLERQRGEIEKEINSLKNKAAEIQKIREGLERAEEMKRKELEKIASLSEKKAKEQLFASIEKKWEQDIMARIKKLETFGQEKLEQKAREILSTIIQRLASSTASEITTTTVPIYSDDLKGKIIGKEGRNIRALERACGVEIIVDDTPGSIVVSSFDPIRRQVAKIALENLILDGRIQPARIEEAAAKAKLEIEKMVKEAGEAAAYETGILNLDPRLSALLGRLHFRTSYGQNVLKHSIEMAHIAGMLAGELSADVQIAKQAALLHDIGKAVDHEVQGSHVEIGRRILQKFNTDERVIKAMQSHHEEYPYETLEAVIVQTADAISGARPGARRDTLENYLKRLEDLENIANSFNGVEKSFAIQAGREIRVFVTPEEIADIEAVKLARNIAERIEQELKYPGEIKVTVIRETRVIEYAR
jgi:ribonuclease Y